MVQTAEERKARKRARGRRYYLANRTETLARTSAYRRANPEKARGYVKAYYGRNLDTERARLAILNAARSPEQTAAYNQKWRAAHPTYERDRYHADLAYRTRVIQKVRRREAKLSEGCVTHEQWTARLAEYDGRCAYCGDLASEMDHVIPLSRGGKHDIANIVPACRPCNACKQSRTPAEWLRS